MVRALAQVSNGYSVTLGLFHILMLLIVVVYWGKFRKQGMILALIVFSMMAGYIAGGGSAEQFIPGMVAKIFGQQI